MIVYLLSKLITICFGMLYPAYSSYKTIKTKNAKEYVQWMMYWIVFSMYSIVEIFLDALVGWWFPLYYEIKICFIMWMLLPTTKGGSILYKKFIHPALSKNEKEIDGYLSDLKRTAENVLAHWGSRAISYSYNTFVTFVLRLPHPPITQPQEHIQRNPSRRELAQSDGFSPDIVDIKTLRVEEINDPPAQEDAEDYDDYELNISDKGRRVPSSNRLRGGRSGKQPKTDVIPTSDIETFMDAGSSHKRNKSVIDDYDDNIQENRSSIPPAGIRKEARLAKQLKNQRDVSITTNSLRNRGRRNN